MSKKDEALKLALKKAFDLGKRYWQQANSDFTSQWRKSDVTLASFNQLVEDTIRDALAEQPAQQQEPFAYAVHFPDQQRGELVHDLDELCEDMTNDENHEVTKLYTHPAPQQADRQRVPDGWKVEALSAGDVRVYGPGNETWRIQSNPGQGTFEDFAHRFLSAIAAAPEAPAQADADPLTIAYMDGFAKGKQAAQASAVDERAAFEAWHRSLPNNAQKAGLTLLDAWQARAALAQKGGAA